MLRIAVALIVLSLTVEADLLCTSDAPINFTNLPLGSPVRSGVGYTLQTKRLTLNGSVESEDASAIFDTANPNDEDLDLGSPNSACPGGGPGIGGGGAPGKVGENCFPLGKVLVAHNGNITELRESCNASTTNPKCAPNDAMFGTQFIFTFTTPAQISNIMLLDPDRINITSPQGNLSVFLGTGENSMLSVSLGNISAQVGSKLTIHCISSCALVMVSRTLCSNDSQILEAGSSATPSPLDLLAASLPSDSPSISPVFTPSAMILATNTFVPGFPTATPFSSMMLLGNSLPPLSPTPSTTKTISPSTSMPPTPTSTVSMSVMSLFPFSSSQPDSLPSASMSTAPSVTVTMPVLIGLAAPTTSPSISTSLPPIRSSASPFMSISSSPSTISSVSPDSGTDPLPPPIITSTPSVTMLPSPSLSLDVPTITPMPTISATPLLSSKSTVISSQASSSMAASPSDSIIPSISVATGLTGSEVVSVDIVRFPTQSVEATPSTLGMVNMALMPSESVLAKPSPVTSTSVIVDLTAS